jgi:hypothetical protein
LYTNRKNEGLSIAYIHAAVEGVDKEADDVVWTGRIHDDQHFPGLSRRRACPPATAVSDLKRGKGPAPVSE